MTLPVLMLVTAIHIPAAQSSGVWMSDLIPVEPGKRYTLSFTRDAAASSDMSARVIFYDEDRWFLSNGRYPPRGVLSVSSHLNNPNEKRVSTAFDPTAETGFARVIFMSQGAIDIEDWTVAESGTTDVKGVERRWRESPWCVVLPERRSEALDFAAAELVHWMKEIGGERPRIVRGKCVAGKRAIYLGRDFLKVDTGVFDSWIITKRGRNIHLAANADDGVVNAVFDLLERNTDVIFARTDENSGTVFTKTDGIKFADCESHVVPAFDERTFAFVGEHIHDPTRMWMRRNYCGNTSGYYSYVGFKAMTHLSCFRFYVGCEFGQCIPNDKYFKEHPEFYGMKEGRRFPYEHYQVQPCYTCKAGQKEIARNIIAELRRSVKPDVFKLHLGFGDTWSLCRCPECIRPVTLPSGRVLTEDDAEFRSYQYYKFLFAIIEDVSKIFPDLKYETLGYLYAAVPPPELEFPKNVIATYCPYPKCCRVPVYDDKHNKKWHERSEGWARCKARLGIYEYYGNAFGFARPAAEIAQKDILYWQDLGFHDRFMVEMPPDVRKSGDPSRYAGGWDFGAMENWVMARLFVNPSNDVIKLRREYCRRAYREAAQLMGKFYGTIREEWFKAPNAQGWSEDPVWSFIEYLRKPGHEKDMRTLLVKAEATAKHPVSKRLIRQTLEQFDRLAAKADSKVPKTEEIPFKGKAYETKVGETRFKAWHDNHNLFVAFDQPESVRNDPSRDQEEHFPNGSGAGIIVRPGDDINTYYHFLATPSGAKYDAKGYDYSWNADGFKVVVKPTERGWRGLLSIPFADVGVNPTVPGKTYLCFIAEPLQGDTHDAAKHKPFKVETK